MKGSLKVRYCSLTRLHVYKQVIWEAQRTDTDILMTNTFCLFSQVWFSNRRSKGKRTNQKMEDPNSDQEKAVESDDSSNRSRIFYPSYTPVPVIRYAPYHPAYAYLCFRPGYDSS